MELAGQPFARDHCASLRSNNRGYAMAALLVGMSVMAVLMSALLPVWTTMARREKEAELVFRGNQYARAIALFQRKFANTPPPSIDVLVEQRFLRKKYKDPITNDDFQVLYANQAMMPGAAPGAGGTQQQPGQQPRGATTTTTTTTTNPPGGQLLQSGFGSTGATAAGGIIGVTSKSKDASLKVFNGRTRYNEWAFVNVQTSQRVGGPGGGPPGAQSPRPGQQGPGQGPGQQQAPFGQTPSPFGQKPSPFGTNPNNTRPGMQPQPPGTGPTRPAFPGSTTVSPFEVQQPRRPPGQ